MSLRVVDNRLLAVRRPR